MDRMSLKWLGGIAMGLEDLNQSEAELQRSVATLLKYSKLKSTHWRVSLGGVPHSMGGRVIYKRNPMTGHFDFEGFTPKGVFWAMELKTQKGRMSEDQKAWMKIIHDNHGESFARIVRDIDEATDYIRFLELS